MGFTYSDKGLALTKQFEGFSSKAYQDEGGVWTIGYGHTGPNVKPGLVISEATADQMMLSDIDFAVDWVNHNITNPAMNQNQFDALVDFCFNVGCRNFQKSTLRKDFNNDEVIDADAQFKLWIHDEHGVVEPGLVHRRALEAALFMGS